MTLAYKLFGKPGNLEELLEKANRAGISLVTIKSLTWGGRRDMLDGTNEVSIQAGPYTISLRQYQETFVVDGGESYAFSSAYHTAERIARQGFAVDVLGMDMQQAEKEKEELYKKWQAGLRSFAEYTFQQDLFLR